MTYDTTRDCIFWLWYDSAAVSGRVWSGYGAEVDKALLIKVWGCMTLLGLIHKDYLRWSLASVHNWVVSKPIIGSIICINWLITDRCISAAHRSLLENNWNGRLWRCVWCWWSMQVYRYPGLMLKTQNTDIWKATFPLGCDPIDDQIVFLSNTKRRLVNSKQNLGLNGLIKNRGNLFCKIFGALKKSAKLTPWYSSRYGKHYTWRVVVPE